MRPRPWSRAANPFAAADLEQPVEAPAPLDARRSPDLEDRSLYFNRELSWLDFNDRVLQLAEDRSVPLLERVKFCAIYEDNLDEFFMVRVADLHEQVEAGMDARGADGMSPVGADRRDPTSASPGSGAAGGLLERELRPTLAEHGIRVISAASASRRRAGAARPAVPSSRSSPR